MQMMKEMIITNSNNLKERFEQYQLKKAVARITNQKFCRIYSKGHYTIAIWADREDNCYPGLYYHPEVNFDKLTVTSHGWGKGTWAIGSAAKGVKEYDSGRLKGKYNPVPTGEYLTEFLELARKIRRSYYYGQ